ARSETGMKKRTLVIGLVAVLVVGGVAAVKLGYLSLDGAVAQAPRPNAPRIVPVDVVIALKKKVPVRVDLLGTVTPIASVAVKADEAMVENLKVQLSYCTIRAPISGRVSMAAVKVGNLARAADPTPLATIIQAAPVYVTFALPQRSLSDLRQSLTNETATIEAVVPGDSRKAAGQVSMIENTVDTNTGTVPVRATMPNTDELLWPGTLVTVQLVFCEEMAVTVPPQAIQVSQAGSFVFVVKDG